MWVMLGTTVTPCLHDDSTKFFVSWEASFTNKLKAVAPFSEFEAMVTGEKELEVLAYSFMLHAQTFTQKLCYMYC